MKCSILSIVLCASFCHAYVMIESSKSGAGKCVSTIYNLGVMVPGEEKNVPTMCMKATCTDEGHISYEGCSTIGLPKNCKFMEPKLNAPFPDCCKSDYICAKQT